MTEISRAAATGGVTQCSDASPEESSSSTAAGKVVDHKQNLAQVMRSIHRALGLLHQLYLTVSSFNVASLLIHRLLIDDGRNPDELTCNVLNQAAKGKTDAFKSLWMHLLEELEQLFPDEVEAYREIRAASATMAKKTAKLLKFSEVEFSLYSKSNMRR